MLVGTGLERLRLEYGQFERQARQCLAYVENKDRKDSITYIMSLEVRKELSRGRPS